MDPSTGEHYLMNYEHIVEGRFQERPNRFVAKVELDGRVETVHVKNTGRCRELLVKGAKVYLEKSPNRERATAYDLVAVEKGDRVINMDSQAPNKAVGEWLRGGGLFSDVSLVRPETKFGNSRFDFYVETGAEKIFIEVKGVTLEEDGVVRFPDAPSDRAVKHVGELIAAKRQGYRVFVLFVIQMEGVEYFTPNRDTHPEFADALCEAVEAGVEVLAYDCLVTPRTMEINRPVQVVLSQDSTSLINNSANVKEALRFGRLSDIPNLLLIWYDKNRRILPWREDPTPYRVWVSEIMLQQTRVEAVKPYFERFMKALPDISTLAEAPEEELLKLWEGLGYYNRVRNLQLAARQIMDDYGGRMPDSYEELLKLKGVGGYTAGAIASIAYQRAVPAVDGNVLRVTARLLKDSRSTGDPKLKACVEQRLMDILPIDRPGDFNQALMELGACVCIPNGEPLCGSCPLKSLCMAHMDGVETQYPKKVSKKPRKVEEKTVLVIRDKNRTAIRKRPEKGLLAGMYEFPTMAGFCSANDVVAYLAEAGIKVLRIQPLEDAKHVFTHREWHMKGYMIRVDELEPLFPGGPAVDWVYVEAGETEKGYPIPSAFSAYVKYLGKDEKEKKEKKEKKDK